MALKIITYKTDEKLIGAVEKSRADSPVKQYIDMLVARFQDIEIPFQEIGGTVRNVLLKEYHGIDIKPSDTDIILDDSRQKVDLFRLCRGLPGKVDSNYYGNVKWKIGGHEIDVMKYSSEPARRGGGISLGNFMMGSDFNLGTIVYDPALREILSLNAIEGIKEKKIILMNPNITRPEAALVRAVNFEKNFGFEMDQNTKDYIIHIYIPLLDRAIMEYMKYKGMPKDRQDYVIARLDKIRKESHAAVR
ncbi:hypothetical protein COV19_06220 [Candidatus Woesearchaeota archaeon CG10_big_fil_rev_8_21_14_0_10_44_13]|nr:MAG: hypothetical protein COV19_06220 [Candidatus Woesearchaeota archaeon CG10_big_fil_rev_8_21_14_0_10_44_13]